MRWRRDTWIERRRVSQQRFPNRPASYATVETGGSRRHYVTEPGRSSRPSITSPIRTPIWSEVLSNNTPTATYQSCRHLLHLRRTLYVPDTAVTLHALNTYLEYACRAPHPHP